MSPRRSKPKSALHQHTMSSAEALIDMHGIVKTFKNAAGEFTVLKSVDLTINRGEFVSIVGKSGNFYIAAQYNLSHYRKSPINNSGSAGSNPSGPLKINLSR